MFDDERQGPRGDFRMAPRPCRGGPNACGLAQPEGELLERKGKEMKAEMLSFVFNSFFESGLFRGLRPIQIEKLRRLSTRLSGCAAKVRRTSIGSPRLGPPGARWP